jgi:hypothetical protein
MPLLVVSEDGDTAIGQVKSQFAVAVSVFSQAMDDDEPSA